MSALHNTEHQEGFPLLKSTKFIIKFLLLYIPKISKLMTHV